MYALGPPLVAVLCYLVPPTFFDVQPLQIFIVVVTSQIAAVLATSCSPSLLHVQANAASWCSLPLRGRRASPGRVAFFQGQGSRCVHACMCMCMCVYLCVCLRVHVCVCVCMCVHQCTCTKVYKFTCSMTFHVALLVYIYLWCHHEVNIITTLHPPAMSNYTHGRRWLSAVALMIIRRIHNHSAW